MPKFKGRVTSVIPRLYSADVEVEARDVLDAAAKVQASFLSDDISWTDDKTVWDEAKLLPIVFQEIPEVKVDPHGMSVRSSNDDGLHMECNCGVTLHLGHSPTVEQIAEAATKHRSEVTSGEAKEVSDGS